MTSEQAIQFWEAPVRCLSDDALAVVIRAHPPGTGAHDAAVRELLARMVIAKRPADVARAVRR